MPLGIPSCLLILFFLFSCSSGSKPQNPEIPEEAVEAEGTTSKVPQTPTNSDQLPSHPPTTHSAGMMESPKYKGHTFLLPATVRTNAESEQYRLFDLFNPELKR